MSPSQSYMAILQDIPCLSIGNTSSNNLIKVNLEQIWILTYVMFKIWEESLLLFVSKPLGKNPCNQESNQVSKPRGLCVFNYYQDVAQVFLKKCIVNIFFIQVLSHQGLQSWKVIHSQIFAPACPLPPSWIPLSITPRKLEAALHPIYLKDNIDRRDLCKQWL